jgi:hypothetical protein
LEEEIDVSIKWRPTFYLKQNAVSIIAVEVAENLFPEILKIAADDIRHFDAPITVYQACPLDVYQNDPDQAKINLLRERGIGIMTVDDEGRVTTQHAGIPLAQNISAKQLEAELLELSKPFKVEFRAAHTTYRTNVIAGLQQASQVVEGIVKSFAEQAVKRNFLTPFRPNLDLADVIDLLYDCPQLKNHRAAFGAARGFVKNYRNAASHPASSAKKAAERIRKCRAAFLEAISVTNNLLKASKHLRFRVKTFVA